MLDDMQGQGSAQRSAAAHPPHYSSDGLGIILGATVGMIGGVDD